jgi:hypothetical protein
MKAALQRLERCGLVAFQRDDFAVEDHRSRESRAERFQPLHHLRELTGFVMAVSRH